MEKNSKPYSEPHDLRLAFASDFASFVTIHNKFYGGMKSGKNWILIPEVPGTLKASCVSDENDPPVYALNIKFRVSYDSEENRKEIESWTKAPVVARYVSAGGKTMISGCNFYPLRFSFSKVEGFDGYECTLKGSSISPECFI
jgi:hypothetical protein